MKLFNIKLIIAILLSLPAVLINGMTQYIQKRAPQLGRQIITPSMSTIGAPQVSRTGQPQIVSREYSFETQKKPQIYRENEKALDNKLREMGIQSSLYRSIKSMDWNTEEIFPFILNPQRGISNIEKQLVNLSTVLNKAEYLQVINAQEKKEAKQVGDVLLTILATFKAEGDLNYAQQEQLVSLANDLTQELDRMYDLNTNMYKRKELPVGIGYWLRQLWHGNYSRPRFVSPLGLGISLHKIQDSLQPLTIFPIIKNEQAFRAFLLETAQAMGSDVQTVVEGRLNEFFEPNKSIEARQKALSELVKSLEYEVTYTKPKEEL